jgi:tRNA(fMet)-specific endonuclease VapC
MPYLLDADWAINALAGRPAVVSTLQQLALDGIAITWITVGKIYEGAFGSPDLEKHIASFRQFISPFAVLDLNDEIMLRFAGIRSALRRRGELIPDFDLLVGATALHHDLTVLTSNYRHLERIPNLKLYRPG